MVEKEVDVCKKVHVRNVTEEDRIQISFKYQNAIIGMTDERLYNFNRLKAEEIEKTLVRISCNVSKEVNKKLSKNLKKIKKQSETDVTEKSSDKVPTGISSEENLLQISLHSNGGAKLEGSSFNDQAWRSENYLLIGDQKYSIDFNPPTLKQISFPQIIMVSFTLVPKLSFEFANFKDSTFKWFVEKEIKNNENKSTNAKKFKVNQTTSGDRLREQDWLMISEEFTFTPSDEHNNLFIKFSCLPKNNDRVGEEVSFISKCRVIDGPKNCPFEKRHKFTQLLCGKDSFRVVCYNILADLYADSEYSRDYLCPYCPPQFLTIDYRKQLIAKELIGYNADIICLQEVDRKVFEADLVTIFDNYGLRGLLKEKMGEVREGCATFYRSSKFNHIDSYDVGLKDFLKEDESMAEVWGILAGNEGMKGKMEERNSVLQVTLLQDTSNPGRHLLIATVHLYFHPRASHIRLIQTHLCIRYLQQVLLKLKNEKQIYASLIYCGDFNAYSGSGVHEYLTGNLIPPTHADWFSGGKVEYLPNMKLGHDLDLINLTGFSDYTNYVGGFNACLDYIYASKNLQPIKIIPLPSHEDVTMNTALPNELFPSDHLAIGCDVAWPDSQSEKNGST